MDGLSLALVFYLLMPALLFAGLFLTWPLAVFAVAAGALGFVFSPGWRVGGWRLPSGATLACMAGGLAWGFLCTGTHHLLYAAVDWQIRDAVLHDLADGGWPVAYAVGDLTWLLRAPVAYYLPPALLGPALAQAGLFLWTALGLALVLMGLASLARQAGVGTGWLVLVFIGFGGLDLLPNLWLDGTQGAGIASYLGRGGEWWARDFQYSGHVTLLLWAPNHALPGWIPVLLLARHGRRAEFAASAGLVLAAALAWGPLSAFGAGVLAVLAILMQGRPGLLAALRGLPNWCGLALALPVVAVLTAGSSSIPHGWLVARDGAGALLTYALFLLVEVAAVAVPVLALARWRALAAALALLALLPLYVFGPGNEMAMRGGIAPLAVLCLAAGIAVQQASSAVWRGALVVALAIGAAGQVMEASILIHPPWRPSPGCTLPEAAAQSVFEDSTDWSHYVIPWPEPRLLALLAPPEPRIVDPANLARCWPDAPR